MKSLLIFVSGLILGALALILVFGFFMLPNVEGCGKCKVNRNQLKEIGIALNFYADETGNFPVPEQGLQVLEGEYLKSLPTDPWGRAYHYTKYKYKGQDCFLVWSLGADGTVGGVSDIDDDVFVSHEAGNCLASQGSKGASRGMR